MRFMIMGPATKESEADILPSGEEFAAMAKFGEELVNAGVLLDAVGLRSTAYGARVKFVGGGKPPTVIDGPFTESKELIAGYWIINVASKAEAIAWASRAPLPAGTQVEIRRIFEDEDFAAADPTGELRAEDARQREEMARNR